MDIEKRLNNKQNTIAKDVLKEIRERLQFLLDVGLTYLTLNRPTRTLSGGESQRIRLATQIGRNCRASPIFWMNPASACISAIISG